MTVKKPRLLDLFCGAGGAARGYQRAGFYVVGVDNRPQPRYCGDEFYQADALTFFLDGFDAIHASPPCQAYTRAQRIRGNTHPALVSKIRWRIACGRQSSRCCYVIENVVGAPLIEPVMLCGSMFPELRTYRHRLFETNFTVEQPQHHKHHEPITKMGRPPDRECFMHVVGNFSGAELAREAMGTTWMTRDDMREAIPPAYTEWLGERLMAALQAPA